MTELPEQNTEDMLEVSTRPQRRRWLLVAFLVGFLMVGMFAVLVVVHLNQPPENFPVGAPIEIVPGTGVQAMTELLERERVVRSAALLYFQLTVFHDTTSLKASTYVFDQPLSSDVVAARLAEGDFDTDLVRLTHIEGERVSMLAKRAAATLTGFDAAVFTELAEPYEGRLFPETYFIPVAYTEAELFALMRETFDEVVTINADAIEASSLSLDEIIVLASIIEREANSPESMKLVSGILQNRLAIDMPLQADASVEYVLDKPLSELTPDDLKIDSPYNTYLNIGLPPTPIGNPGKLAIEAVLEPTESDYYYYLTDEDGEFHYAETYDEHLKNIERYLR